MRPPFPGLSIGSATRSIGSESNTAATLRPPPGAGWQGSVRRGAQRKGAPRFPQDSSLRTQAFCNTALAAAERAPGATCGRIDQTQIGIGRIDFGVPRRAGLDPRIGLRGLQAVDLLVFQFDADFQTSGRQLQLQFDVPGQHDAGRAVASMPAEDGRGQSIAHRVVNVFFQHHSREASMTVTSVLSWGVLGSVRISNLPAVIRRGALIIAARRELHDSERPGKPGRLDRQDLPRGAGGEAVMPAEIESRWLVALDPQPKQFVVASQVHFQPRSRPCRHAGGDAGRAGRRPMPAGWEHRARRPWPGWCREGTIRIRALLLLTMFVTCSNVGAGENAPERLRVLLQHVGARGVTLHAMSSRVVADED